MIRPGSCDTNCISCALQMIGRSRFLQIPQTRLLRLTLLLCDGSWFLLFLFSNSVSIRCVLSPSGHRLRFQVCQAFPLDVTAARLLPAISGYSPLCRWYSPMRFFFWKLFSSGTPVLRSFGQTFVPILYLRFLPAGSTRVSSLSGTTGTLAMRGVTIGGYDASRSVRRGRPD